VSNLRIFGIWLAFTAFVVVALLLLSRAGDPPEMMIDAAVPVCGHKPNPCATQRCEAKFDTRRLT
jgi:hypothetical protein